MRVDSVVRWQEIGLLAVCGLLVMVGFGCGPGGGGGGGGGNGDDAGGMQDTGMNGECDNPTTYYEDSDGDSYGNPDASRMACSQPSGFVRKQGDCDDSDPAVNPDGTEKCDGKDNDCNGMTDDGLTKQCSKQTGVCSGASASCEMGMFPTCGANEYGSAYEMGDETSCDNQDNDCDGNIDEGISMNCPLQKGVCSGSSVQCSSGSFAKCDASAYGSDYEEKEMSSDGKDNDCDGLTDNAVMTKQFGTSNSSEYADSVAFDATNNAIYVAYRREDDFEVAKWDLSFSLQWDQTNGTGEPGGVAVYSGGVLTGGFVSLKDEFDLEKNSLSGARQWDQNIKTQDPTNDTTRTNSVAVNPNNGDVYMVGASDGSLSGFEMLNGGNDILMAKFPEDGSSADWAKLEGGSSDEVAKDVAIDPNNGDLYITGWTKSDFGGATNPGNVSPFLAKYSSSGSQQWVEIFGPTGNSYGKSVAYDSNNDAVYVSGSVRGAIGSQMYKGNSDGYVAKYDSSGNRQWVRLFGTSDFEHQFSIAVDESSGAVYLAGASNGDFGGASNQGGSDVALVKYDSSGSQQWTRLMGTAGLEFANDIALDPNTSDIYVVGETDGTWDSSCSGCGADDAFLLRRKE